MKILWFSNMNPMNVDQLTLLTGISCIILPIFLHNHINKFLNLDYLLFILYVPFFILGITILYYTINKDVLSQYEAYLDRKRSN